MKSHLLIEENVQIHSLTNEWTTLVLAGPLSRQVMQSVSRADWSATAFPWLSVRETFVGIAPVIVMAVSFSGELAYEIHVPNNQLYAAYLALRQAGKAHGLCLFGSRAVESMRIEKGFLHWKSDILTEFDPFEAGLDRFVNLEKPDFIGKSALERRRSEGPSKRLVTLSIECDDRTAAPGSSVMKGSQVVGTVTTGAWGHRPALNLALAYVEADLAAVGTMLSVDLLGSEFEANVIPASPYDGEFSRVKM